MNAKIEFKINETVATNLINGYARSVAERDRLLEEYDYDEDELYSETDYAWQNGYIYCAETFLNALGISPKSNKVQDAIKEAKE